MHPRGSIAIVLHAHLPFVRHPEHPRFLEEDWLFEALTESYLPLLCVLDRLVADDVDFRLSVGLTPTLLTMLDDELLQGRYRRHLDRLIDLAERESTRLSHHAALGATANFYAQRFRSLRTAYDEQLQGDVIGAFRHLQEIGRVELIASAATHAYLPNLRARSRSLRAQIEVGVETYRRTFGCAPQGFWLPECAYIPGLDRFLRDAGIRYFFIESHGVLLADGRGEMGIYAPIVCPSGVAAFGRDPETSRLVWSAEGGYPGDPEYRDFYKDVGYDAPHDLVQDALGPNGERVPTGLKLHRVTGRTPHKQPYVRERALSRVEAHAADFVARLTRRFEALAPKCERRPLITAPYDAELFGHWWFEGPEWLGRVLRRLAQGPGGPLTVTPSEYLAEYPEGRLATPAESSWGEGGYHQVWINTDNDGVFAEVQSASARMERLADARPDAGGRVRETLDQAAREVLLAQSSDWPFLQRAGTAPEYARRRQREHLDRFRRLADLIEEGALDGRVDEALRRELTEIETSDAVFPWLDYRLFARRDGDAVAAEAPAVRRVAFISAEAVPWAKVGGLGDVAGALPIALAGLGVEVVLVLPGYRSIERSRFGARLIDPDAAVTVAGREESFRILEVAPPAPGVRVLLVDHPGYFDRDGLYVDPRTNTDYPDAAERFLFFCRAALETLSRRGERVDVLHCHDHQTAMALALQRLAYRSDPAIGDAAGVFTLHNLGYQGIYGPDALDAAGIDRSWFYPGSPFEFWGHVNLMKVGIVLADKVNAVSETYAREIREDLEFSERLDGVLAERGDDLVGILNGMDVEEWNPATDRYLAANYSVDELAGKRECKKQLLERMGLDSTHVDGVPLIGMVTRLVDQKGLDLIAAALDDIMALGVDIAVLGTGMPKYHALLEEAAKTYAGRVGVALRFDNAVAHQIEAGADMFLMPSRYEPCGLNQMYSLRYGTVPIVRATGGLADTVNDDDVSPGEGVGFRFEEYEPEAMLDAIARAVAAYRDRERWLGIVRNGMRRDNSWAASAQKYLDLYEAAVERRQRAHQQDLSAVRHESR